MLPPKRLHRPEYTVGLEPRREEVISLLNQSNDRVCMLGVYGTGGIGKTTLAKSVYNSMFYQFEGACFLFDVQEESRKYLGIVRLQQKLLSEILEEKILMIGSVDEGISKIKHRLSHKKVLLVLDDVDDVEQLEQLAGGCDWFGFGSKILITTRDKQLLIARNVEKTYGMRELNEHDSLELFCWYAFHMCQPPKKYQDMSSCVISYAKGLPLALRAIGSNLANKKLEEWRSILEQYERIPERTIHDVLKISYDCLQDGAKRTFLDIACFQNEMLRSIEEMEALDFGARFYLEVLIDKSLIVFDNNCLCVHDLIRQMGREIVRQEAPSNPEKRSRLWYYKDVLKVFRENLGCNNIEGILLDPPKQEEVEWSGIAFEKMNNLRILIIRNVHFSIGPTHLPNNLRWLEWKGYPSATLPSGFSPSELVVLKLPGSSFRLKEPLKSFSSHMTHMDFSHCEFMTELPDMSQLQSLRRLELKYCSNLIKVHDSVGSLSKLETLDADGCTKLSIFPREIKMASLESLHLNDCTSLEYFPHVVGKMDALTEISIDDTAIIELPPSIGNLSRLHSLTMYSSKSLREIPTSLFRLPIRGLGFGDVHPHARKSLVNLAQHVQPIISTCLKGLYLMNCGLLDEELDLILNCFPNLQELNLSRNDFVSLPKCIKQCAQLYLLDMCNCKRLRDIPELPSKVHYIIAQNCTSLTAQSLDSLYYQAKNESSSLYITMPARTTTFPYWFDYWCEGGKLCFRARTNLLPQAVLAVEFGNETSIMKHSLRVSVSNNNNGRNKIQVDIPFPTLNYDDLPGHLLLFNLPISKTNEELISMFKGLDWNDVELQVMCEPSADVLIPDISIVKCGVYAYKHQTNMENVQFKSPSLLSRALLKRRAIASPPNQPSKKLLRNIKAAANKGKLSNPKKGSRRVKRHQAFHSCDRRKMAFPMAKHVCRFLYHH